MKTEISLKVGNGKRDVKKRKLQSMLAALGLLFAVFCSPMLTEAKVYLDITSPGSRPMPLAIQEFVGTSGREMSDIVRDDLNFTGLFTCVEYAAHLEGPSQPFNRANWTPLRVEAVAKGRVHGEKELVLSVVLYDVSDGKEVFRKEYRADKGLVRPLAHSVANDIYLSLTGEPGIFRSKIAFVAEERNGKFLDVMDWDGHRIWKTGVKGNIILTPRWSKDGSKLLYSAERNRRWGIYVLDLGTMKEKKIFSSSGTNLAGDFTPDGKGIIFSSSKGGSFDLYSMSLSGGTISKITSSRSIEVSPSVSFHEGLIAFISDRGGNPQIYTMREDGSDIRRITFAGSYNTSPMWSKKGDKIVFSGRRGKNQIMVINPDGSEPMELTSGGNNEEPSFSPDGRYVAFTSDRDGRKGIYIMRANGEAQKRITSSNVKASGGNWSPN